MLKKIAFLDRDGTINTDPSTTYYVHRPEEFFFVQGVMPPLKELISLGYELVLISNQAGVGKGRMSQKDLDDVTDYMLSELKTQGIGFRRVCYCIHAPGDRCECRKPETGLLEEALSRKEVDLNRSVMIGDSERDIRAGQSYGVKSLLILTGKSRAEDVASFDVTPDAIVENMQEAVNWIKNNLES